MADQPQDAIIPMLRQIQRDIASFRRESAASSAELRQDIRMLRGAVNDIARENVTPGEIEALHHDVNRVMEQQKELAARIDALEGNND